MIRDSGTWLSILALSLGACEGRDVVVFSASQGGTAGIRSSAAAGGPGTLAGAAGGLGGSPETAGSGGAVSAAGGSGGDTVDKPCRSSADCDPSLYCEKLNCSASEGVCLPRPLMDDPRPLAVCGCEDNKTYWNDTLRQRSRISASTSGPCTSGARQCFKSDDCCSASDDCSLAACSVQLPKVTFCATPGMGQCWVIPKDCASADDEAVGLPCPPPGPPGPPPPCLTLCQALQARRPYVSLPSSYNCP
jgi:hypothetical protein